MHALRHCWSDIQNTITSALCITKVLARDAFRVTHLCYLGVGWRGVGALNLKWLHFWQERVYNNVHMYYIGDSMR